MARQLLHQLIESASAAFPDRLAVGDRGRVVSYLELETRANRLANFLISKGIETGDRVGIYLEKSIEALVGIHGVLKAGAAYVPLDPRAPTARTGLIADDCQIRTLLTSAKQEKKLIELIPASLSLKHAVFLDKDRAPAGVGLDVSTLEQVDQAAASKPDVRLLDQDLAYILYTSGSTGVPKGVMLTHRNALGFVDWAIEELAVTAEDRLSNHAPFHFDLSIFDVFAAAGTGASVHLVPAATSVFPVEVSRFIDENQISIWYSVPSILSLLVRHGNLSRGSLPSLRHLVFAGEVFPSKYLARLMELLPHVSFHNWYGPTETNVCTAYQVKEAPDPEGGDIPIGRPIANVGAFAMTSTGLRANPGEEGELLVRGATVMVGYWGDSEKTAGRLVPDPLGGHDRVYRTGDIVVEDGAGDFRFLGRLDHQIKSRGYRIELGEIESALFAHPDVVECAVIAVPDELISNRIHAHVVGSAGVDEEILRGWCVLRLPRYMIPEVFEFSEALPKTATGKIDRQALTAIT